MNEWRLIIFKRFVQSHGVGQWHSQNVHLTPVPLLVGHTGRGRRGDVCPCEVHAAGGASRGGGGQARNVRAAILLKQMIVKIKKKEGNCSFHFPLSIMCYPKLFCFLDI